MTTPVYDCDFLVIGSGFGGSVAAMRLVEKGFKTVVLEQGKRFTPESMPKTTAEVTRWYFLPKLGLKGFFSMRLFGHMLVLHGNAVGGGSITYASTLLIPPTSVWQQGTWAQTKAWDNIMPKHYAQAEKMLGVAVNRQFGLADDTLKKMAEAYGVGDSFYPTRVGIYFGDEDEHSHTPINGDPYFQGMGPKREPCVACGGCMVGCRYRAKNTLDYNYLYFAEQRGADLRPQSRVTRIQPLSDDGRLGYVISYVDANKHHHTVTSRGLVLSAGTLGTLKLLFQMRDAGLLPHISNALGQQVYTNAESIIGVRFAGAQQDYSQGVAIGSGIYLNPHTHIEATRYPKGSDTMGFLLTFMHPHLQGRVPMLTWLRYVIGQTLKHPKTMFQALRPKNFAQECMIFLCMQTLEHTLTMRYQRGLFGKRLKTQGRKIPATIPEANAFAQAAAKLTGGMAMTCLVDVFLNIPITAHCMGGCAIAATPEHGVCDAQHRVFGYQHFYICDGSNISANLGVNPSLTITALTEVAMSELPVADAYPW